MNERKMRKILLKEMPIETERLVLRYIELKDAYDMYEYASIPEVCEYLLWDPHINLSATEGYIEFLNKRYLRGLYADWAVVLKSTGKMIGTCGYAMIDTAENYGEIGYVLSPYFRGKGYMSEAVKAVLELSFEKLGLSRATLRIIEDNLDSIRLAERLGFAFDGNSKMEIKGRERDIVHYSFSQEQYERIKNEAVI